MAETIMGVMPDFPYQWDMKLLNGHNTLVKRTKFGREQRMAYYPIGGYPVFGGDTTPLNQHDRATMRDFINSMRGKYYAFNWFRTQHANFYNYSFGTIASVSSIIIPFKNVIATIDDNPQLFTFSVAGISKAFTITEGAGTYGEARVTFTAGVQSGATVGTFAARLMTPGRFDLDEDTESFLQNAASIRTSFVVRIQGL